MGDSGAQIDIPLIIYMDFVRELLPSLDMHDIMIIQDRIDALDDKFYSKKATMNRDEIVNEYIKRLKEEKKNAR